jgi:arylsulfatase A-like enzyme
LLDLKPPKRVTGKSLLPLIAGTRTGGLRDTAITGWGVHATVRTHEWAFITRWLPVDHPHNDDQLYDVQKDPEELINVADQNPAVIADLRKKLNIYIDSGRGITNGTFSTDMA